MPNGAQELSDMMKRVASGDRVAFETLYDLTSGKLYGVIVRIVINRSVAEDILQEVYVKVWQRATDFDAQKASPITWMATIARNRAIDEIRRAKPARMLELSETMEIPAELEHPLDSTERGDTLKALIGCLNGLAQERRQIILLAYYKGWSREDLASRYDKPVATIKTWLHRGLAQLKTCLAS